MGEGCLVKNEKIVKETMEVKPRIWVTKIAIVTQLHAIRSLKTSLF